MRFIKEVYSIGQTHGFDLTMKCGHRIIKNTELGEDQSKAAILKQLIVQKWLDREKGLPEIDFDIVCPECQRITKFTEIQNLSLHWDNHLREY